MPELDDKLEGKTVDELVDGVYDPKASSAVGEVDEKKEEEKPEVEGAGAEPETTEKPEAEGEEPNKEIEDKIKKISELLGDDEEAINAYIKKEGFHKHPAWQRQRDLIEKLKTKPSALNEEDKALIDKVKQVTSSPEFIRASMKSEGYKDEAINAKLRDLGHKVESKGEDDFSFVLNTLGVDVSKLDDNGKNYVNGQITDMVKIASLLIDKKLKDALPNEIKPLEDNLKTITRERKAQEYSREMQEQVKSEGVLDYKEDIEPKLYEFMEANPDAVQEDIIEHFQKINHELVLERTKTGKRKTERDEKKLSSRPSKDSSRNLGDLSKIKPVTGSSPNEVDKDIGRLVDEVGYE